MTSRSSRPASAASLSRRPASSRTAAGALLLLLALSVLAAVPARAADVLEPWGEGLSNVEMFATFGSGLERADTTAALGAGLPYGFSLGVTLASPDEGRSEAGLILVWTRSLGRLGELDLWGEYVPAGEELDLTGAQRLYGVEWSGSSRRVVPYVRLALGDDGESRSIQPLLGGMLPVGERLELHLELSSEEPESGSWPLQVAVGPNWKLTEALEVLPELAVAWEPDGRGGRDTRVFFTIGFCLDPTTLGSRSDLR